MYNASQVVKRSASGTTAAKGAMMVTDGFVDKLMKFNVEMAKPENAGQGKDKVRQKVASKVMWRRLNLS